MYHFWTKPLLVWLGILLLNSCQPKPSELIDFGVSEGVMNQMDFSNHGIQKGQKLEPVNLKTLEGESFYLNKAKNKRPILLITGSYTCDITRGNLLAIDSLYEKYKDVADIFLINTLEAHPESSQSPYSAEPDPWPSLDNQRKGIAAEQPRTMNDRRILAEKWIDEQKIKTPVLLDGAKNEFWNQAGQAPNMSVLFSADGVVIFKQPWFEGKELEAAIIEEVGL
jgi:hypothetical protein